MAGVITFFSLAGGAFVFSLVNYTATQEGDGKLQAISFIASLGCMALCVPVSLVVLFITGV